MLEKYGMFRDENGAFKVIYKDEKGYIDVDFLENDKTDTILISPSYDSLGENLISLSDIYFVINRCFRYTKDEKSDRFQKNKNLEIYIRSVPKMPTEEWIQSFRNRAQYLKSFGYNIVFVLTAINNVLGTELDNTFIYKMLHTTDYSKGEELNFLKWVKKYKIEEYQREDYLEKDEYFMSLAKLSAMRSKDPNTQVGACIVNEDGVVLSTGYNGAPKGYKDYKFPWKRIGGNLDTKYFFVVHAEKNAILNFSGNMRELVGSTLYVDLFPCNECAKAIIQVGISEVVYLSDKYADTESTIASKMLFDECGVKYRQLGEEHRRVLTIDLRK